jgi:hypothetical protein
MENIYEDFTSSLHDSYIEQSQAFKRFEIEMVYIVKTMFGLI